MRPTGRPAAAGTARRPRRPPLSPDERERVILELAAAASLHPRAERAVERAGAPPVSVDDVLAEGVLACIEAVDRYHALPSKARATVSLRQFAYTPTRTAMQREAERAAATTGSVEHPTPYASEDLAELPDPAGDESFRVIDDRGVLRDLADYVTDRERQVIELRFGRKLSYSDIGVAIGLTPERIRQIERDALVRIRRVFPSAARDRIAASLSPNSWRVYPGGVDPSRTSDLYLSGGEDCSPPARMSVTPAYVPEASPAAEPTSAPHASAGGPSAEPVTKRDPRTWALLYVNYPAAVPSLSPRPDRHGSAVSGVPAWASALTRALAAARPR